jgi:hypothetical protein
MVGYFIPMGQDWLLRLQLELVDSVYRVLVEDLLHGVLAVLDL